MEWAVRVFDDGSNVMRWDLVFEKVHPFPTWRLGV